MYNPYLQVRDMNPSGSASELLSKAEYALFQVLGGWSTAPLRAKSESRLFRGKISRSLTSSNPACSYNFVVSTNIQTSVAVAKRLNIFLILFFQFGILPQSQYFAITDPGIIIWHWRIYQLNDCFVFFGDIYPEDKEMCLKCILAKFWVFGTAVKYNNLSICVWWWSVLTSIFLSQLLVTARHGHYHQPNCHLDYIDLLFHPPPPCLPKILIIPSNVRRRAWVSG